MRKLFYVFAALLGLGLSSCEGEATLGKQIAGEWSAGSTILPGIEATNAVTTDFFEFLPDSSYKGGDVQIVGMFTITLADNTITGVNEAVSTTVSGKSAVHGKYSITSHDEMVMNLAIDSVNVEFDPSTVVLENNILTSADSVATGSMTATQLNVLKAQVIGTLQAKYAGMRVLDDVKVKGNQMEFEVLDVDYHLIR